MPDRKKFFGSPTAVRVSLLWWENWAKESMGGGGKEKEKGRDRPRLSNGSNTSGATRRSTTTTTSAATASPNKRKLLPFFQRLRRRTFILQERTLNNLSNRTDGSDVVLDSIYTISESEVS